jgi:hypothetical protein
LENPCINEKPIVGKPTAENPVDEKYPHMKNAQDQFRYENLASTQASIAWPSNGEEGQETCPFKRERKKRVHTQK